MTPITTKASSRTSHSADTVPGKVGYWAVGMDDITIDGSSVTTVRRPSSTLHLVLAAPSEDIKAIAKAVGAHTLLPIPPFNREYFINCTTPGPTSPSSWAATSSSSPRRTTLSTTAASLQGDGFRRTATGRPAVHPGRRVHAPQLCQV